MTRTEIETAVRAGRAVYWGSRAYRVVATATGWFVVAARSTVPLAELLRDARSAADFYAEDAR